MAFVRASAFRFPPPTVTRGPTALALALTLAACVGLGSRAEEIRRGLIALDATSLRTCLGTAPFYEIRDDGSELWAYTAALRASPEDIQITRSLGSATSFQRPRVEAGSPIERRTPDRPGDLESRKVDRGQCLYVFGVQEGQVRSYRASGRSLSNMNADSECTLALRSCIGEPAPRAAD